MDHYGIGAGLHAAAQMYFLGGRGRGRTTSLVDSVKNGDRVVFVNEQEARRVKRLCKERGVEIEVIVNADLDPGRLFSRGAPSGDERTIFDHSWIEHYYMRALERTAQEIDRLQIDLSGRGAPHRTTAAEAYRTRMFTKYES